MAFDIDDNEESRLLDPRIADRIFIGVSRSPQAGETNSILSCI